MPKICRIIWNLSVPVLVWLLAGLQANGAVSAPGDVPEVFRWRPFLAPLHAVVLHFPIGFLAAACVLEGYRTLRPTLELQRATGLMLWLALASGIAAAAFGILRAESGGYEASPLSQHRLFGFLVLGATLCTILFRHCAHWLDRRGRTSRIGWIGQNGPWIAYRLMFVATLALLVVAGHLGGNLTHGSQYLVENAPAFLRKLLAHHAPPDTTPAGLEENARFFESKVRPIFEEKCVSCHGREKKKGGYRLDRPEEARTPGASGHPPIVPGDPLGSHLVRLFLLPPSHDDVMPPEGKKQLTPEEIGWIIQWIREGARFPGPEDPGTAEAGRRAPQWLGRPGWPGGLAAAD